MKKAGVIIYLSLLVVGISQAQITYIDAVADPVVGTVNTTATSGDPLSVWYQDIGGNPEIDDKWSRRYASNPFGNGADDVFQARVSSANNIPELTTTITGLTPGQAYRIYVFFWDADSANQAWNIDAGLVSSVLTTYAGSVTPGDTGTSDGYASNLTFTTTIDVAVDDRNLLYADVGWKEADASGEINVYVDNSRSSPGDGERSWYDGVGYVETTKPISETIFEDDFESYAAHSLQAPWTPATYGRRNNTSYWWIESNGVSQVAQHRPGRLNTVVEDPPGTFTTNSVGGSGWRGLFATAPLGALEVEESIEISMDYKLFVNGLENAIIMDCFMSTNNATTGVSFETDGTGLGFRATQSSYTTPENPQGNIRFFFDPLDINNFQLEIPVTNLGFTVVDSGSGLDLEGDDLKLTYTAKKIVNADEWLCNLLVSNKNSGLTYTMSEDLVITNAAAYSAIAQYLSFYTADDLGRGSNDDSNTGGYEIDNLVLKLLYVPPPSGWDAWIVTYNVVGGFNGDDDGDGQLNGVEYALEGGDPTNATITATEPTIIADGTYCVTERNDVDTRGVSYSIQSRNSLTSGGWNPLTPTGSTITTNISDGFDAVYYDFDKDTDAKFLRLRISKD